MWETGVVVLGKIALQTLITESIKNIVNKNWRWETDAGKKILEHFQIEDICEKYTSKIKNNVLTFRSLSQGGKNVSLEDVYYPLKVTVKDSDDTFLVTENTVIKHKGIVVISGSAGQGKTTVLRKMFIEEIKNGERFPFFITLRNVGFRNDITLIEIFVQHLQEFGVIVKEEEASLLLQSTNVVLFFDGFDEIANKERVHALNVLKSSWNRYTCQVIVTTRPNTELYREGGFKNLVVNSLLPEDISGIINKSVGDTETRDALVSMLNKKKFIMDALIYPILVDIFIVSFYSMKDTPATIGDFYNGLFRSLLFSHDQQKNFARERKSGLDVKELQDCFNCFSLISFLGGKQDFSENELEAFFIETCDLMNKSNTYKGIKDDIVDGTNLISLNGYKFYSYIHRSIQEYHAALYISGLDDVSVNYKKLSLVSDYSHMTFLSFLHSIDEKKFYLFYVKPYLKSLGLDDVLNQKVYDLEYVKERSLVGATFEIKLSDDTGQLLEVTFVRGHGDKYLRRLTRIIYLNSLLDGTLNNESIPTIELLNLSAIDVHIKDVSFLSLADEIITNDVSRHLKNNKSVTVTTYKFSVATLIAYDPEFIKFKFFYESFIDAHRRLIKFYIDTINPIVNARNPNEKIRSLIKRNNN